MRILVALDGSERAEAALGPAAKLARAFPNAFLALLRVVESSSLAALMPAYVAPANQGTLEACDDYLREVTQREEMHGVVVDRLVATGAPATTICATARSLHADLIVMASHGRSHMTPFALGSVATAVVHESAIPTLILPDAIAFKQMTPLCMLVPLDGSHAAEAVLDLATQLAQGWHAEIHLLRVIETAMALRAGEHEQLQTARHYLEQIQHRLAGAGITTHASVTVGNPSARIMQAALHEQLACDVIALSIPGRVKVGGVAAHVLNHLQRPLLIVHPQAVLHHANAWPGAVPDHRSR